VTKSPIESHSPCKFLDYLLRNSEVLLPCVLEGSYFFGLKPVTNSAKSACR